MEEEGAHPNSFYEARTALTPRLDKGIASKENYR